MLIKQGMNPILNLSPHLNKAYPVADELAPIPLSPARNKAKRKQSSPQKLSKNPRINLVRFNPSLSNKPSIRRIRKNNPYSSLFKSVKSLITS